MAICLNMVLYFMLFGALVINIISFNPLLTYTVRLKNMYVKPNFTMDYYTIDLYKDAQYINGQITINSNKLINKVVGLIYRCDSEGINCDYFQTWILPDICTKLKDKNQVWSRWYDSFDPPMQCPIDKVHYKIKNGTFDVGALVLWYPQATNYQWRIIQKMYADDIYVGTYTIEFSIFGYRKRIKSILKL